MGQQRSVTFHQEVFRQASSGQSHPEGATKVALSSARKKSLLCLGSSLEQHVNVAVTRAGVCVCVEAARSVPSGRLTRIMQRCDTWETYGKCNATWRRTPVHRRQAGGWDNKDGIHKHGVRRKKKETENESHARILFFFFASANHEAIYKGTREEARYADGFFFQRLLLSFTLVTEHHIELSEPTRSFVFFLITDNAI